MENMDLGNKLRKEREARGYTLKQLAEKSDLSIGFISQVERGQTEPSLASLKKLCEALGIKMRDVFEQDEQKSDFVRKGSGQKMVVHDVKCELLAAIDNKTMEVLYKVVAPGGKSGQIESHPGEEFVWVKSGKLSITIGETTYILNTGDSVYFKASQPHACINNWDTPCEVLWVSTPPLYT